MRADDRQGSVTGCGVTRLFIVGGRRITLEFIIGRAFARPAG
jgi:hypothetical protein